MLVTPQEAHVDASLVGFWRGHR